MTRFLSAIFPGISTHVTKFGPNANFAQAKATVFGAHSTATYNSHKSYHIRLGDQKLTETQVEEFMTGLVNLPKKMEKLNSRQLRINLPRAMAAHNDYKPQKEREPCFEGTREAVLKDIANWFIVAGTSQIYVLSGLAGIGKSTIAYTVAQRADRLGLLGASFFFSRKEAERRTAEKLFTTIAFQLCVYDDKFAHAIQRVLATNQGEDAVTKGPETQLKVLIIEPLRVLVRSRTQPVVIVVDALDECEDDDAQVILKALGELVHEIPSFKILLTTRPQPHLNYLLDSHDVFYLHNIEDKIINKDIRRYLKFKLSIEQVKLILPTLETPWNAIDDDIDALVRAADKLFIVASISVLFILNKAVRNPASQMERLKSELAENRTPIIALDDLYSIILHAAVPPDGDRFLLERFKMVVGTIALLYDPLPIDAIAHLVGMKTVDIRGVLDNLQSVVLLGADNIPHIFHKSFSDWIMNPEHCKDKDYRIDPRDHDTWLTTRCLQILNERLIRNILNFDGVAQFMTRSEALKQKRIKKQIRKCIPPVLRYACVYWTRHLNEANVDDADLVDKLKIFADNHLLHWIEAMIWIKPASLYFGGVHRFMEATTLQDLRELLSDALRFMFKFNPLVEGPHRSVHFIYHSALPFAPTESRLYQRYHRETMLNLFRVQGGPKSWDPVITSSIHGQDVKRIGIRATYCTVGTNLDIAGVSKNEFVWSSNIEFSAPIVSIAFSSESRAAVALSSGSITLWDTEVFKQIAEFDGFGSHGGSNHHLVFSPNGDCIAYRLYGGGFALRNAINGEHIANLHYNSAMVHRLVFSPDSSQLASLFVEDNHKYALTLWDSTDGKFLGAVQDIGSEIAISVDGSLIATGGRNNGLTLWSRYTKDPGLRFIETPDLNLLKSISCLAFSQDGMLAIGSADTGIILYDVAKRSFITTIPFQTPTAIEFVQSCTRLAVRNVDGDLRLLDVPTIKASAQTLRFAPASARNEDGGLRLLDDPTIKAPAQMSQESSAPVSALVFSSDCSRLVSGSEDGIIRIWNTSCASEPIATYEGHSSKITTIAFGPNGSQFASGDANGTIKLWSNDDYALSNIFQWPIDGELTSMAVSKYVLAAATNESIALWDLQNSYIIRRLGECGSTLLSFSNDDEDLLLASFDGDSSSLVVWNIRSRTPSATFKLSVGQTIEMMVFYRDNSNIFAYVVEDDRSALRVFHAVDETYSASGSFTVEQGTTAVWKGIPVWMFRERSNDVYCIVGWFSSDTRRTVCWLPDFGVVKAAYGSSMFALLCRNGDLLLLQSN